MSERQTAANQANAQFSTGPKTEAGRAISSRNALKTGLTGRTILLPEDDAAAYEAHLQHFVEQYEPANDRERELVQSLADTRWRLNRIPSLEAAIYALARVEFAAMFPDESPEVRAALIQAQAFVAHQKQFSNLSIQEVRLRRHFEKDLAELLALQKQRRGDSFNNDGPIRIEVVVDDGPYLSASGDPRNGFEFSGDPCSVADSEKHNPTIEWVYPKAA